MCEYVDNTASTNNAKRKKYRVQSVLEMHASQKEKSTMKFKKLRLQEILLN